jgi:hypothetical protein
MNVIAESDVVSRISLFTIVSCAFWAVIEFGRESRHGAVRSGFDNCVP